MNRYLSFILSFCAFSFLIAPNFPSAKAGTMIITGAAVVPPAGFIRFCIKYSQECPVSVRDSEPPELSRARRTELDAVQAEVNAEIEPREAPAHAWDYASSGFGDCNTYALTKRRALIALGWPERALLLAAAYTERGEGHLVLIARTSQGDLALDNRLDRVVEWTELPYRWVSMQSPKSPARWLQIVTRGIAAAETEGPGPTLR
jgi:predicted transglutaminase-like cysteine proteinase